MPIKLDAGEYATALEVAQITGWDDSYVKRLLRQKKMRGFKLQRDWLIPLVDGYPIID